MGKKVAIVYDWIDKWGGVERILVELKKNFPELDFYTSYLDLESAKWAKDLNVKTTFLQYFPKFIKGSRLLSFIFYPYAFESLNLSDYDLVISITSSFAKSIITKPSTKHICYLLTPPRYLYSHKKEYLKSSMLEKLFAKLLSNTINWDKVAAYRPDQIYSISKTVQKRCLNYYGIKSSVIYPGLNISYWKSISLTTNSPLKKTFLIVSRLEPYKKIDVAIKAFNKLDLPLTIVGIGSEMRYLRSIAKENITFIENINDFELAKMYSSAQALIMPQEEDFGYVSLEAQIFGCPVIAYGHGGAKETIVEGKSGIFFAKQTENSLIDAIERFSQIKYNLYEFLANNSSNHLKSFDIEIFLKKFKYLINKS